MWLDREWLTATPKLLANCSQDGADAADPVRLRRTVFPSIVILKWIFCWKCGKIVQTHIKKTEKELFWQSEALASDLCSANRLTNRWVCGRLGAQNAATQLELEPVVFSKGNKCIRTNLKLFRKTLWGRREIPYISRHFVTVSYWRFEYRGSSFAWE